MTGEADLATIGRAIVDESLYMTLATADAAGLPWPTPVYFAPAGYRELIWVSRPEARHSQNIAVRADVGIVVFDSRAPISTGQAVYMSAMAELVPPADLDRCLDVFSRSNQDRGGSSWVPDDVGPPRHLRLYRAIASEQWVLDEHDRRVPMRLDLSP
jgi:hypothetical protein